MIPIIISYDCISHDPIEEWVPVDPSNVDLWMNFTIGSTKEAGDNFQVRIVTPNNLHGENSSKNTVVINIYKLEKVLDEIQKILNICQGEDWQSMSSKLSEYMDWEFQDYKP